jgi:hypothetical protein
MTRLQAETRQNRRTETGIGLFNLWPCRDWAIEGQSLVKTCRPGHWVVAGFFCHQRTKKSGVLKVTPQWNPDRNQSPVTEILP